MAIEVSADDLFSRFSEASRNGEVELIEIRWTSARAITLIMQSKACCSENTGASGKFELRCNGVLESSLGNLFPGGQLREVSLLDEHPLLWNYSQFFQIYGKAPLPDPYRFYWDFTRLLRDNYELDRDPVSYLNAPQGLAQWELMCYGRAFLMMRVPEQMLPDLSDVFYAQAFEYTVLKEEDFQQTEAKMLRLDSSWVVAKEVKLSVFGSPAD